jgi:four helix bundle protein
MCRELEVWHESVTLIKAVYIIAEQLPKSEEFNLKQQLKRAVVSVSLNIAEGKNRRTSKDFCNFLVTASASLAEVDAIIAICAELGYLELNSAISDQMSRLGKRLSALRTKISKSGN